MWIPKSSPAIIRSGSAMRSPRERSMEAIRKMKTNAASLTLVLALASLGAYAKEHAHDSGTLLQMDSAECGTDQKSGKSLAGEIIGTDGAHQKTHMLLCQEYLLQSDRILYRIRPRDDKHPVLLPVGQKAQFRLDKDKMKLRVEDMDDKERDYIVVSMTPRQERSETAERK
jgi:hypothetical protein